MRYFKPALFALLIGTFVGSAVFSLLWLAEQGALGAANFFGQLAAMSLYGLLFAMPIVCLYGIPLYALLDWLRLTSWVTAFLFGSLPGVCWVLWMRGSWVDPILINGISIAMVFHMIMRRLANKPLQSDAPKVRA